MDSPWMKFNYKKINGIRTFPLNVNNEKFWVLINPDFGSWTALREEEYEKYKNNNLHPLKLENLFLRRLVKRGNNKKVDIDFPKPDNYPSVVVINITTKCNMACKYCFADDDSCVGEDMNDDVIEEIIRQMFDMPEIDKFTLEFQGGEPLLYFEGIKKAVKYAESLKQDSDKDVRYRIETNGTLITDKVARFAKKYNIPIGISIDGPKELNDKARVYPNGNGTFDDMFKGLKKLNKNGLSVAGSVCTIGKHNVKYPEKIAKFFRDLKISFKPRPVNILGKELETNLAPDSESWFQCYKKLYQEGKETNLKNWSIHIFEENTYTPIRDYICLRSPCGAAREIISINPNGDVFPCDGFKGVKGFAIGNLMDEKITDILRKPFTQKIRNRDYKDIKKCSICSFRGMCGSCIYSCYGKFGNIYREDPYCQAQRKIFTFLIKNWIKENKNLI